MATAFKSEPDQESVLLEAARPIIGRLSRLADDQVRQKALIEQRWLDDLSMYFGRYDAVTQQSLEDEKRSTAFVKLTRHKTNSWAARIGDILFPTDQKNWDISPTPIPMLAQQAKDAVKRAEAAVEAANQSNDPQQQDRIKETADSFAQMARQSHAEIEQAKKACGDMRKAIDDQLTECDYVAQCRDVIEDGCRLGTGILKGPLTAQRLRAQWRNESGSWGLVQMPDPMPDFRRVDPWHFFPDMSAAKISEAEFSFERHLPTKKDLKRLARKLSFNRDAIGRLLEAGPKPLGLGVDHLAKLRLITQEGEQIKDRYLMWEYHGALECDEICDLLRSVGQSEKANRFEAEKDPLEDYRVILYFCDNEVLKIAPEYPMDSGDGLYSVWNFEKGETSVFGIGVPNIMADSQRALNAAWRMIMDNAALAVGPQTVINQSLIRPVDGSWSLRPFKTWLLSSTSSIAPNVKPFETFNIPIQADVLLKIIELAKEFIDEETGMPTIAQGEQGAATQTAGGMSMLFNSANVVFRRVVKMWDDEITKPTIRRAYDWNMQFNPDDKIKGDMQVDAKGSSVLLVREIQSQNLMQIATNWTTHPEIGPWFAAKKDGVRPIIAKTLETMMLDVDELIATMDEYEEYQRRMASQKQDQPSDPNAIRLQIAQLQMQSAEKLAQMDEQTRLQITQMQHDTAMIKMQAETGMTQQELEAKYGLEHAKLGSQERMKAVDIAVEDKRAKEAVAQGQDATAATGKGVG